MFHSAGRGLQSQLGKAGESGDVSVQTLLPRGSGVGTRGEGAETTPVKCSRVSLCAALPWPNLHRVSVCEDCLALVLTITTEKLRKQTHLEINYLELKLWEWQLVEFSKLWLDILLASLKAFPSQLCMYVAPLHSTNWRLLKSLLFGVGIDKNQYSGEYQCRK